MIKTSKGNGLNPDVELGKKDNTKQDISKNNELPAEIGQGEGVRRWKGWKDDKSNLAMRPWGGTQVTSTSRLTNC